MQIGHKVHFLSTCHSTNDVIKERLAVNEFTHGELVVTQEQTKGRGQRGNVWESEPDKNLTFSFYLNDLNIPMGQQFVVSMHVSLALQSMISTVLGNTHTMYI